MSEHNEIYLEPKACSDEYEGQFWCEDSQVCENCGRNWIRYVRDVRDYLCDWQKTDDYPEEDGFYLWRLDSFDEDCQEFNVIKGMAFKGSSRHFISGGEWKKK